MAQARRPQIESFASGSHIKWSVLWVKPTKKGDYTIIRKDFGNDLTEALRIYNLAVQAGKPKVTLRSNNVGFPPPPKYRPHTRRRIVQKEVTVLRRGKRVKKVKKVLETYDVVPMQKLNRKGFFWCPYCREFRKFQRQSGFPHPEKPSSFVEAPGLYCPLCGVSHRDLHVRRYNPIAERQYVSDSAPRRGSSSSTGSSTQRRSSTARSRRRS